MQQITAAILIIGNEILSGRTQDVNIQYIASKLSEKGIHLEEVRIIPDIKNSIIENVQQLSTKYTYLFTTGGIGPTHDDITSESIAEAFGLKILKNHEAYKRLAEYYLHSGREMNEPTARMAMIPEGATLIDNKETAAPGFIIENVYVMAGVPYIMQAMIEFVLPTLQSGSRINSQNIDLLIGESTIAHEMETVQTAYPTVSVGSYPFKHNEMPATSVVFRSSDEEQLKKAFQEFSSLIQKYEIIPSIYKFTSQA